MTTPTIGKGSLVHGVVCGTFRVVRVLQPSDTTVLVVREVCRLTGDLSRRTMRFPASMFRGDQGP